jgi:hypothetical protein
MINFLSHRRWSGEGDNGEIECKDGFQKHYSAQGSGSDGLSEMYRRVGDDGTGEKGEKSRCFILWCLVFIKTAFPKRMIKRPRCQLH